jgi:hypothetical protein
VIFKMLTNIEAPFLDYGDRNEGLWRSISTRGRWSLEALKPLSLNRFSPTAST